MPLIILLDVSLSMAQRVSDLETEDKDAIPETRESLAAQGIRTIITHYIENVKLDYVSLVVFSSLFEIKVPFTRDYQKLISSLDDITLYNKTSIESALLAVTDSLASKWDVSTPLQIILITDGHGGCGPGSLRFLIENAKHHQDTKYSQFFPFPFDASFLVVCLASTDDSSVSDSLPLYERLIRLCTDKGKLYVPKGGLTAKSATEMFQLVIDEQLKPFTAVLRCGNLHAKILLCPSPLQNAPKELNPIFQICGFLRVQDAGSPPVISRHLILPLPISESALKDPGGTPCFTVLLHGSLKTQQLTALVEIGEGWYGMLNSCADSKHSKKANLVLSVLEPGYDSVPWLGNFQALGPLSLFKDPPYGKDDAGTPFQTPEVKSYTKCHPIWVDSENLKTDMQKLLRFGKKLPEKNQQFYKELNRIRQAAVSYGFFELLESLAAVLDRECQLLPGTADPAAALQLTHASSALRKKEAWDKDILPLKANFQKD